MPKFRRISGGHHGFLLNGKRVSVRPGDVIECNASDLGKFASDYAEVEDIVGMTPLQLETERCEFLLKPKSIWLNEKVVNPGTYFEKIAPSSLVELEYCLFQKTSTGEGTSNFFGELPLLKAELRRHWNSWKKKCKQDNLGKLNPDNPRGRDLELIAETQARINILEMEVVEIKRRIEAAQAPIVKQDADRIKKLRYKCFTNTNDRHEIIFCDGRPVIQKDGKPCFEDTGQLLTEYLEEAKQFKLKRRRTRHAESEKAAQEKKRRPAAAVSK